MPLTPGGGTAESKFIGNTILICPVGALTSQVYRFRARPWDNQPTQTTCTLCPVGCSKCFDQRDGEIMRTRSVENRHINDIWLCDKGWFGYEFTSSKERLQQPLLRKERGGALRPVSWDDAISHLAEKMIASKPNGKIAALGGNPLTFEENNLFQKLFRQFAQVNHIDHRVGMPLFTLDEEGLMPGMETSIGECEELSFALILGCDLTEEFPLIWLRLRQAINRGATVIFIGHFAPEIAPHLTKTLLHPPGKEIEILKKQLPEMAKLADTGKKGAIFVGRQYLANAMRSLILSDLMQFSLANPQVKLNVLEGSGNSLGARLAGMRPDIGPLGEPVSQRGLNVLQVLEEAGERGWDLLYVAGANPALKYPSKLWNAAREKLAFLVVQDLFLTETASQADLVLPVLCYAEKSGHFVNIEGRLLKLQPGKEIPQNVYSDGEIFQLLSQKLKINLEFDEQFTQALSQDRIILNRPSTIPSPPNPSDSMDGLKASFSRLLFDHGVRMKQNLHLVQLVKEAKVRIHPNEGKKREIQNGDLVRLSANGHSIRAKIQWDDRVAEETIVLPLTFEEVPVRELANQLLNGMTIEIAG